MFYEIYNLLYQNNNINESLNKIYNDIDIKLNNNILYYQIKSIEDMVDKNFNNTL